MLYLKNRISYATYCDPVTRQVIGRGAIAPVKTLSKYMSARIRAGGLIKCTEEEYKAYVEKSNQEKTAEPKVEENKTLQEEKPSTEPKSEEEPKEDEGPAEEENKLPKKKKIVRRKPLKPSNPKN